MIDEDKAAPAEWGLTLIGIGTAVVCWCCDHFLDDFSGMFWIGVPALLFALLSVLRADWR